MMSAPAAVEDRAGRPRLLIISHDVIGRRMAGPGIRSWELARVLAAQQPVTLIAPEPIDREPAGFALGSYARGAHETLLPWLEQADVVLANAYLLLFHPRLAAIVQPLALDMYDPTMLEGLEQLRAAPAEQRLARAAQDRALLELQLAAGDYFLCATERQRDLYVGALMGAGRITPAATDADPELRGMIDVVSFGLPAEPPARQAPALREVWPGIGADDPLLLWTGGLWDWLDPQTLVEAMPQVVARHPAARLVFLAGRHPANLSEMRAPGEALQRARALGLLDRHIFFYDQWVPYDRRADFLLEATLAVSLHRSHLETAYAAVRSRFLDHLWAGLPSVVTDGDAAAELVRRFGLGRVVPPQDPAALSEAIAGLLDDPAQLDACAANARAQAAAWRWERTTQPLARWTLAPRHTRGTRTAEIDRHSPEQQPGDPALDLERMGQLVRRLEPLWQLPSGQTLEGLSGPQRLALAPLLRALQPLLAQQSQMNAALLHTIYWIAEELQSLDRRQQQSGGALAALVERLADQELATTELARQLSRERESS